MITVKLMKSLIALVCATSCTLASGTGMPPSSQAQQDPFLARCETLKRQADRNTCIAEVIRSASHKSATRTLAEPSPAPQGPSPKEIAVRNAQDVFAAADAIKSVTAIGVSYNDYGPYIQRLAIALDAYRSKATLPEEMSAVELLAEALDAWKDAREFWRADIEFFARSNNRLAYPGGLPVDLANVRPIVSKYYLSTNKADWLGLHEAVPRGAALSKLWDLSGTKVSLAHQTLDEIGTPRIPTPGVFQFATSITDDLKRRAEEVFAREKCAPAGELRLGAPMVEQDVIMAACTDGRQQTVACGATECKAIEVQEFRMKM